MITLTKRKRVFPTISVFLAFLFVPIVGKAEVPVPCAAEPTDMLIGYGDFLDGDDCAINPAGDTDIFRFSASVGEVIVVFATDQSRSSNPYVCITLFDPDGLPTANGGERCANTTARIDETITRNGIHSIRVRERRDYTMAYGLALERLKPASPNAASLCYGCSINEAVDAGGDVDQFILNGTVGDTISLQATDQSGSSNPYVCITLFDPDGLPMANGGERCANTTARIDEIIAKPGIHAALVREASNYTMPYLVDLQCIVGACVDIPNPPVWPMVYQDTFAERSDLDMFRSYRDGALAADPVGKFYTGILYKSSDEALNVLMDNPALIAHARSIVEANKGAVELAQNGEEAIIYDTDEIAAFLLDFARQSPPVLQFWTRTLRLQILQSQRLGSQFLGFYWQ